MKNLILLLSFTAITLFTGCSQKVVQKEHISEANIQKASYEEIAGFQNDNFKTAFEVFTKGCEKSQKNPNLTDICKEVNSIEASNDPKAFFTNNFTPYKLIGDDESDEGLITGYYEPLLKGSIYPTSRFKYPIYQVPFDLVTVELTDIYPELKDYKLRGRLSGNKIIPYKTRAEIDAPKNRYDRNLKPICYVDNKVDLFFLHIQGSGKVLLEKTGKIINVGYAGQNGRKYYSIGKKLIEDGHIKKEEMSLQAIKKWFSENPSEIDDILNLNKSYVFFKNSKQAATGSLGVELVANRNLAVDRNYIPLGFPVFINTTNPITNEPINQLMVAADTGGAIKGKIRADFFFGNTKKAEELAGKMKQKGKLYLFIPKKIEELKED